MTETPFQERAGLGQYLTGVERIDPGVGAIASERHGRVEVGMDSMVDTGAEPHGGEGGCAESGGTGPHTRLDGGVDPKMPKQKRPTDESPMKTSSHIITPSLNRVRRPFPVTTSGSRNGELPRSSTVDILAWFSPRRGGGSTIDGYRRSRNHHLLRVRGPARRRKHPAGASHRGSERDRR